MQAVVVMLESQNWQLLTDVVLSWKGIFLSDQVNITLSGITHYWKALPEGDGAK